MKKFLKNYWDIGVIILVLSVFYYWGIQFLPFHPDETTQLFMSSDFDLLFSKPSEMFWESEKGDDPRQRYRELDAPLTKYILGFGRLISGLDTQETDWNWSLLWSENLSQGSYPDTKLLFTGRRSITLLLPISVFSLYLVGRRNSNRLIGIMSSLLFGTNAVVLFHGRRAMAEGALLFGVAIAALSILYAHKRPGLAGLGLAIAFNAKQSALALLPVAFISLIWIDSYTQNRTKKRLVNLVIFSFIFIFVTLLLNPLYWQNPIQAVTSSIRARSELIDQQITDILSIAPENYLDTPVKRGFSLFLNTFISPPEYGLVGNLASTREDVDKYISVPGHNLFRGIIWGSIMFGLTLLGIYVAMRKLIREKFDDRDLVLLILATLSLSAGLIAAVPISWVRYSIPLIPFICIWTAYGISSLIPRGVTKF